MPKRLPKTAPAPKPQPTSREAARNLYDRAAASGQRLLMAEFVACLAIDAIRFAADYSPAAGSVAVRSGTPPGSLRGPGSSQGTSLHGGKGPLSVLGGILGVFFVLSLLPQKRVAAAAGAVVTAALLINSESQLAGLAAGLKAGPPAAGPPPKSSGTGGASPPGSGTDRGIMYTPKTPGQCEAGYTWDPALEACVSTISGPPLI